MLDPQTQALLQAVLRRESRSMLVYVGEAYPWTTAFQSETQDRLLRIIDDEKRAIAALGQYLARRHVPVYVGGSYPESFTTINFLALDYLLPRLVASQRRSITELERDLARVTNTEARAQLEKLLTAKRGHLEDLEALGRPQPQPLAS